MNRRLPSGVATITERGLSSVPGNTASSVVVPKPAGTVSGDVLYVAVGHVGGKSRTVTAPTGWQAIHTTAAWFTNAVGDKVQRLFRRVCDGSEGANFTFTASASGVIEARCIALANVDNANPEDIVPHGYYEDFIASDGILMLPAIYTYSPGVMLLAFFLGEGGAAAWTAPAGMTERMDVAPVGGPPYLNGMLATETLSTAGPVYADAGYLYPGRSKSRQAVTGNSFVAAAGTIVAVRPAGSTAQPAVPTPVGNVYNITPANHHVAIEQAIRSVPDGTVSTHNIIRFPSGAAYSQASYIFVPVRRYIDIDLNDATFTATYPINDQLYPNFLLYEVADSRMTNGPGLKSTPQIVGNFNPTQSQLDTWLDAEAGRRISTPQVRSSAYTGSLAFNQFQHGAGLWGGNNFTFDRLHVANVYGDGLACAPAGVLPFDARGGTVGVPQNTRFDFNKTVRTARHGLSSQSSLYTYMEDNICNDSWYWGIDNEIDDPAQEMRNHFLRRNTFDGHYHGMITFPAYGAVDRVTDITVEDNVDLTGADGFDASILFGYWDDIPANQRMDRIYVRNNTTKARDHCIWMRDVLSGACTGNSCAKGPNPASGPAIILENSAGVADNPPVNTMGSGFTVLVHRQPSSN
jgi:hypothetical protein